VSGLSPDVVLGAHLQRSDTALPAARSVLLLGAAGRLGEAILAALTSHSGVATIDVATIKPIEMGVARVRGVTLDQLHKVDIVLVHLLDLSHMLSSSFYGRDAAFAPIDEAKLIELIAPLLEAGAKHLVVVKPLSSFQQIGGHARQLISPAEMQLHQAAFESLTIIRPAPLVESSKGSATSGSFLERFFSGFFRGYLRLNFFTMPNTFEPIRTDQLAPLIVDLAMHAQPGLKIFTADQLRVKLDALQSKV
jgi:hypothetical protein